MSNKTRLQTNNTNLQALIDKANSLPDADSGGGSGGGSVETCSLTITDSTWMIATFIYQSASGELVVIVADPMTPASGTYEVACGSMFYIDGAQSAGSSCNGCKSIAAYAYMVTAGAGESATIDFR